MKNYKNGDVILNGIYEITGVTDGGTAYIYKARNKVWDIDVAIKIPTEEYLEAVGEDEFKKECENWIELGAHPHIALCYLVTKIDGQLAAISEWADDGTLYNAIVNETLYEGESNEVQKRILKIAAQMLSGIKYAHSRGIINKDIKPHNVLLAEDSIRITDFGLSSSTVAGHTLKYASPEQIKEKNILSAATDIYSWAVTVMEMYCGDSVWLSGALAGKNAESLLKDPDNAAAVPEEMISLLCECLVQSPTERPSAEALLPRLERVYQALTGEKLPDDSENTDLRTADVENNRAVACIEIGETEKAQKHWEKALKIAPGHAQSLYNSAISKDEVWFEQLKKDLEASGVNEENHAEIFEEIKRAQGAFLRDKRLSFELNKTPKAITFDDDGQHLLVKQSGGEGVSIDLQTGEQTPCKRAAEISPGASEHTVGERTLLAKYDNYSFGGVSIGDKYNGKTRWFTTIDFASTTFCVSPDGKRLAVYIDIPSDKVANTILVIPISEPYSCKYLIARFQSASELERDIKLVNSLLDNTDRDLKANNVQGALDSLDALDSLRKSGKLSGNSIQRYISLKRALAKHCDRSEPTVLFSRKLMSAPVLPFACAISSNSEIFAFLMPDRSVEIYEMRDNELRLKCGTSLPNDFQIFDDTYANIRFTENDEYLAVCYKTDFYYDDDTEEHLRDDFLINIETMDVSRGVRKTEPPKPPKGVEISGERMSCCYSADGFTALSYKWVTVYGDNVIADLNGGEDGHPVLHILDYKLTPAATNRIDEKKTTRKKGWVSDNMDRSNNISSKQSDDNSNNNSNGSCYNIPNPDLEQARMGYVMKKKAASAAENREQIFTKKFAELKVVREKLLKEVIGQDHAVEMFIRGLFCAELSSLGNDKKDPDEKDPNKKDSGKKGPKAIFTFAGPPGTGKSMLAKTVADLLGLGNNFLQLDMSEYANYNSDVNLIGLDASYKDSSEGALTRFVHDCNENPDNPGCVLLFDEIEKAHPNILKLFYQILEDGHLTDKFQYTYDPDKHSAKVPKWKSATVSFEDAIVIFTSNVGRSIYEDPNFSDASAVSEQTLLNALMTEKDPERGGIMFLPSALVSRLSKGKVIMFNKLKADSLCKIAHNAFEKSAKRLEDNFALAMPSNRDFEMAMLFSLGGETDARRLTAKVDSYISDELYKILNGDCEYLNETKELRFVVEIPEESQTTEDKESREVRSLFVSDTGCTVLAYVDNTVAEQLKKIEGLNVIATDNTGYAAALANTKDIDFALIDVGLRNNGGDTGRTSILSLNAKRWSEGKGLFDTIRKNNPETRVYVLNKTGELPEALVLELINSGAAGCIEHNDDAKAFANRLTDIAKTVHMQNSAAMLALGHRQLSFNSAFEKDKESSAVTVKLRDLSLERAPLANDAKFLLNSIDIPKERFSDVIGARLAVEALSDYRKFFENPREFTAGGRAAPKGVLLYGMPGTGKTMLAKAMAGECGVAFIQKTAAELYSADELKRLFETARKYAPAIIFLDEVDTIAKARSGIDPNRESILNALLTEMDGFKVDAKRPVFVLAATNYGLSPSDGLVGVLDEAFCRRFDKCILIEYPNMEDRKKLIAKKLKSMNSTSDSLNDKDLGNLADIMAGLSPSAINRVLEAALGLADNDEKSSDNKITLEHINTAFENIMFGEKKTKTNQADLKRVATHEAGHALIYHLCGHTPSYLTIEARGNFGGYMRPSAAENKTPQNRRYFLDKIRCLLGGRAAEVVIYGEEFGVNVGACSDLQKATNIAVEMITQFGMDEKVGLVVMPYDIAYKSEALMSRVNEILEQEFRKAKEDIVNNREKLNSLVEALVNKQCLTGNEIKEILGDGKETE